MSQLTRSHEAASTYSDPRYTSPSPLPGDPDRSTRAKLTTMASFNLSSPYTVELTMISRWYSHYQVVRSVADDVLEDDMNMVFDLEKRLHGV